MSPWLPRFRTGGSSNETIDGRGLEGRFIQIDWLDFSLSIEVGSVSAHDRFIARITSRKEN